MSLRSGMGLFTGERVYDLRRDYACAAAVYVRPSEEEQCPRWHLQAWVPCDAAELVTGATRWSSPCMWYLTHLRQWCPSRRLGYGSSGIQLVVVVGMSTRGP